MVLTKFTRSHETPTESTVTRLRDPSESRKTQTPAKASASKSLLLWW